METTSFQHDLGPNASTPKHGVPLPAITQLPTELLAEIIRLTLPPVDSMLDLKDDNLRHYMRTLYTTRLVAKRWQEVVDGIPSFWKFVLSTLPSHVNNTTILRSDDSPLIIVYSFAQSKSATEEKLPSPKEFLGSVANTRPRWSTYSGPVVSEYLETPAPLLRNIMLNQPMDQEPAGPLQLLGGSTTNLHVHLSHLSTRWEMGLFTNLTVLRLVYVGRDGLTTGHLLDFLRASPGLEYLELGGVEATVDNPPSSSIITLSRLRSMIIYNCGTTMVESVLHQIQIPSCSHFYLNLFLEIASDLPRLISQTLEPFGGLLSTIHRRNGSSEISITRNWFQWHALSSVASNHDFSVFIGAHVDITFIRWVERILQDQSGLHANLSYSVGLSEVVLDGIASMRCLTKVTIGGNRSRDEIHRVLHFLGEPLSTNPSLPSLPSLRLLHLSATGWNAQDLVDTVQARFSERSWEGVKPTPLKITLRRGAFSWKSAPRPILDLATLNKIRESKGVESVKFVGSPELDDPLAVIWDGDASEAVWG